MRKIRLRFSKTGRARFLSHLDTMRVLQRVLTRAGVPAAYSEGYNPHMHLSILVPLSLGLESVCELADLGLSDPGFDAGAGFAGMVNAKLPEGFGITEILEPSRPVGDIKWIKYSLTFESAEGFGGVPADLTDGRPLVISKKGKRGVTELDIAPHIKDAEWELADRHTLRCGVLLSAANPTVNPSHLAGALSAAGYAADAYSGRRLLLLDGEMKPF